MKGYKGFEKGLICKGKQYAENTVFEEEKAEICKSGMHFCKNPLDCLDHYPLIDDNGNMTEFAEVEALDEVLTDDNKKYCTKKLKIGAKLDLAGFIKASLNVTKEQIEKEVKEKTATDTVENGLIKSGGYGAKLAGGRHSMMIGDNGSIAQGKKGALIVLVEREWQREEYVIKSFKAEIVDGERIKEDTPYKLENGKFVEANAK